MNATTGPSPHSLTGFLDVRRGGGRAAAARYARAAADAVDAVSGCDVAGLSITLKSETVTTLGSTHASVELADGIVTETNEGPCLYLGWPNAPVYSAAVMHDRRWPHWGHELTHRTALRSILLFHVLSVGEEVVSLALYSVVPAGFNTDDWVHGRRAAAAIAHSLEDDVRQR